MDFSDEPVLFHKKDTLKRSVNAGIFCYEGIGQTEKGKLDNRQIQRSMKNAFR